MRIAVVGTGISGLSAAWLLNQRHDVTVYEAADRIGGHSNTVLTPDGVPVDTGFIVFNRKTYPNLTALFGKLGVETKPSNMSFAVSMDGLEYSSDAVLAQGRNLFRPRFWKMLSELRRFCRDADRDAKSAELGLESLAAYLTRNGYSDHFRDTCLLPLAAAIWSAVPSEMMNYPAQSFIRFHDNHRLLQLWGGPAWETVSGGSREYVERLAAPFRHCIRLNAGVRQIRREDGVAIVSDVTGHSERYDHVVLASHADQALGVLADPSADERRLLGAFRYSRNVTVLHTDKSFMPKKRAFWSAWNYIGRQGDAVCVTYWMNRLQNIPGDKDYFVTLNPTRAPHAGTLLQSEVYEHPVFDTDALLAQHRLWQLQGVRNTWFCGAHFGAGFHEDGLQSGLAVGEQLGGVRRPWQVENESGRIVLGSRLSGPMEVAA